MSFGKRGHVSPAAWGLTVPLLMVLTAGAHAELSNTGRDFWLAWVECGNTADDHAEIILSSDSETGVAVEGRDVRTAATVRPGAPGRVSLPRTMQITCGNEGCTTDTAIHISSERAVNVQLFCYSGVGQVRAQEIYLGLPTVTLGKEWYILTFPPEPYGHVIPTAEATVVRVDRTHRCHGLDPPKDDTVMLSPPWLYSWDCLACAVCLDEDASGTHVTATEPVVVIAGNDSTAVPNWGSPRLGNILEETMLPVCTWGSEHYTIPLPEVDIWPNLDPTDLVRIIASSAGAQVLIEDVAGSQALTLGPGEWTEAFLEGARITSDRPVMVVEYAMTRDLKGFGGPMEMLVVPVSLFKTRYRFVAVGDGRVAIEYVSLVAPVGSSGSLTLDGSPVGAVFTPYAGGGYEVAVVPIPTGEHVVEGTAPFGAYVLGYQNESAYGSPAGMLISEDCLEGCTVIADAAGASGCENGTVTLDASPSTGYKCGGGLEYQWSEGATVLQTFGPAPALSYRAAVSTVLTLQARCAAQTDCVGSTEVRVTAVPDPVPPDQGNVLRAVKEGPPDAVKLVFLGATGTEWRIFRDGVKAAAGTTPLSPDVTAPEYTDAGVLHDGNLYFYRVKGLSPCSRTLGP